MNINLKDRTQGGLVFGSKDLIPEDTKHLYKRIYKVLKHINKSAPEADIVEHSSRILHSLNTYIENTQILEAFWDSKKSTAKLTTFANSISKCINSHKNLSMLDKQFLSLELWQKNMHNDNLLPTEHNLKTLESNIAEFQSTLHNIINNFPSRTELNKKYREPLLLTIAIAYKEISKREPIFYESNKDINITEFVDFFYYIVKVTDLEFSNNMASEAARIYKNYKSKLIKKTSNKGLVSID